MFYDSVEVLVNETVQASPVAGTNLLRGCKRSQKATEANNHQEFHFRGILSKREKILPVASHLRLVSVALHMITGKTRHFSARRVEWCG